MLDKIVNNIIVVIFILYIIQLQEASQGTKRQEKVARNWFCSVLVEIEGLVEVHLTYILQRQTSLLVLLVIDCMLKIELSFPL